MAKESDEKKSFKLYNSYGRQFEKLDDESAGQLIKAVFAYVNNQPVPELSDCGADMAFSFIAAQLDRDKVAYDKKCEVNRRNGSLGGRPPKPENQTVFEEPNALEKNRSVSPKPQDETPEPQEKPADKPKSLQEQRFDQFWQLYPKKVGKKAAFNSWNRIRPDEELFNKIIQAVTWQKESADWKKDGGRFIPNPLTWLNQGRWDNEPFSPVQEVPAAATAPRRDPTDNPWRRNN
ncbi:MAG: DUF6291 domain-containing protein [Oscillospiraceae bacterium]|nr:DUF6291 domain-containing protein [Oscillospiraceae bacterium]